MSHVAEMDTPILDLDCLEKACKAIGLELVRGQKKYRWYGRSVGDFPLPAGFNEQDLGKCEHAIRVPGNNEAYEIGVVKRRGKPGYTMMWDFWNGGYGMEKIAGKDGNNMKHSYSYQLAKKKAPRGFRLNETKLPDGRVIMKFSR